MAKTWRREKRACRKLPSPAGREEALLVGPRAGEGAAQVAEELGLEQPLRQRPAVHGDEGAGGARAVAVDGAGHELLAGAGLAGHEDGGVGGAGEGDLLVDAEHGPAAADEAVGGGSPRGDSRGPWLGGA